MTSLQISELPVDRDSTVPPRRAAVRAIAPPDPLTGPAATSGYRPEQAGEFRFDVVEGSWWWSDEVYAIHGFTRGEVVPTAELLLAHTDPADRDRFAADLGALLADGVSFCCRYRMFDAAHRPRVLLCRGEAVSDAADRPAVRGFLIDVTASERRASAKHLYEAIEDAVGARVGIEQAKGVLAAVYGVGPEQAFDVLRRHSQHCNIKVRVLAAALIERLDARPLPDRSPRMALEAILSDLTGRLAEQLPAARTSIVARREPPASQHLWDAVWAARACSDPRVLGHAEDVMARLYRPLTRDLAMEHRRGEVCLPVAFRAALSGLDRAVRGWQQPEVCGFGVFAADQITTQIDRTHDQLHLVGVG